MRNYFMKKSLLATAILGLATATCANAALTTSGTPITGVSPDAQSGFPTDIPVMPYAQIDLGATSFNFSDHFSDSDYNVSLPNKVAFGQRLTFGVDFQGDRIGLDFTNFGNVKYHNVSVSPTLIVEDNEGNEYDFDQIDSVKVKAMGVGLSYIHAMILNSSVRPYIGARLGYTHLTEKVRVGQFTDKAHKNSASIGALAGVEVDVARNVTLGIGAEYDSLWGSKATAISGNAFMRVYF